MTIVVEFNPNLRVHGSLTVVDLSDQLANLPVGFEVVVIEHASGIVGRARVAEFDLEDASVLLWVDWDNLRVNANMPVAGARATDGNAVVRINAPVAA